MNQPRDGRRVAVVGGGITGLTAAYRINRQRPDVEVVLLERTARLGGNIRTEQGDGFLMDAGPDAFLRTKLEAVELGRLLGPLGSPVLQRVYRYPRANPQPLVGHPSRLRRIAAELRRCPGLHLAGGAYRGVGIPDCIAQARDAAARALAERC
jgi:protoporphyrinogen oxidase